MTAIYAGLPGELGSPMRAAQMIARLPTAAARLALFDRLPGHWQATIGDMARQMIAADIVALPTIEARRAALVHVPLEWRREVESHVLRLWTVARLRPETAAA